MELLLTLVAKQMGYGKNRASNVSDVFSLLPSRWASSGGWTQLPGIDVYGAKKDYWHSICSATEREVIERARRDKRLQWSAIFDLRLLREIAADYGGAWVFHLRVDGSPWKTRRVWNPPLWITLVDMLCTGQSVASGRGVPTGIFADMAACEACATHPGKLYRYHKAHRGGLFRSDDISGWDESWWWLYIALALKAVYMANGAEECLAVLCIALLVAGPYVNRIVRVGLQPMAECAYCEGDIRSGAISLVPVNDLLKCSCNYTVTEHFDGTPDLGLALGDDGALATSAPTEQVSDLLHRHLNLVEKPGSVVVSADGFVLGRKILVTDNEALLPVIASLFRNAMMPEADPRSIPWAYATYSRRVQTEIIWAAGRTMPAYRALRSKWLKYVCPERVLHTRTYPELDDLLPYIPRSMQAQLRDELTAQRVWFS
jgi:hypothetical protein